MELANKGFAQLAEWFGSMTPGARVTAALLLVVTALSVAYLFNTQVSGAQVYLMGEESFSAAELREMQAAFGKAGLEAEIEGARIKIPGGQESKYMAALADADALPTDFGHHMQQAVNAGGFLRIPHSQQEAAWRVAYLNPLLVGVGQLAIIFGIGVGGYQVLTNAGLDVGQVVAFTQYLSLTISPLALMAIVIPMLLRGDTSAERILAVYDDEPQIQDKQDAQ